MPATDTYSLNLWADGDTVAEDDIQKVAYVLDRLGALLSAECRGVVTGWSLGTDKTATAGSGLVGGCFVKTTGATDLSTYLTNDAINYVYVVTGGYSADLGTPVFGAVTNPASVPAGAVQLGSITLDAGGTGTASDDNPILFLRDYLVGMGWYRITPVQTSDVYAIPAGTKDTVTIDHSAQVTFGSPGKFYCTADPRVTVIECAQDRTVGAATLLVFNDWVTGYGYGYGTSDQVQISWQVAGYMAGPSLPAAV